jgi:hypothetical protein
MNLTHQFQRVDIFLAQDGFKAVLEKVAVSAGGLDYATGHSRSNAHENDYLLRIGNNAKRCIIILALYIIIAGSIHEVTLTTHNDRAGRIRQESHSITHRPADAHIPLRPSHDHTAGGAFGGGATTRPFHKSALTFAAADLDTSLPTKCQRILQKTERTHDCHYEKVAMPKRLFPNFISIFLFSISTLRRLTYDP